MLDAPEAVTAEVVSSTADDAEVVEAVVVDVPQASSSDAAAPASEPVAGPSGEGDTPPDLEAGLESALEEPLEQSTDCVICLAPLGDEPQKQLVCEHTFHEKCIGEWVEKNGTCPVCRRVVDEAAAARAGSHSAQTIDLGLGLGFGPGVFLDMDSIGGALLEGLLLAESRRLMMFATMEGAMSLLVLSYISDLFSPAMMLAAACTTFYGASQFSAKALALCRPLLGLNLVYHLYISMRIMHVHEGKDLLANEWQDARSVLLSILCVAMIELVAIKKAGFIYLKLITCSQETIDNLLRLRRGQLNWVQRFVLVALFLLICSPVFAKNLCQTASDVPSDVCTTRR